MVKIAMTFLQNRPDDVPVEYVNELLAAGNQSGGWLRLPRAELNRLAAKYGMTPNPVQKDSAEREIVKTGAKICASCG